MRSAHNQILLDELQRISRILLIRLRSLGDAILTLPLIEALHAWRPDLKQSVLIEAPFAPVFHHHPAVSEVLVLRSKRNSSPEGWNRLRTIFELRKRRFPAVLNLHGGSTSMLFTMVCGASLRIGQENHRASGLYNRRIPASSEIWQRSHLHTVEHQLSLLRSLAIPLPSGGPTLHVPDQARAVIRDRLSSAGIRDFILIQPTATLATKQWQAAGFAELGDRLSSKYGIPILYTAAPHETATLNKVSEKAKQAHTYWSDLRLIELFALIERCRLFIGCDSGPTHAAAALGKPIVVVWGSSNYDAWHPWKTDFEAVRSDLPCIPCPGYNCSLFTEPRCIREIQVSRVTEACERMLARATPGLLL